MNVVVDGLITNYHKTGSGKTIILLHGWGSSKETFKDIESHLKDHNSLLAVDLPGFGGTQPPPKTWNLEDYALFVAAWLAKIGENKTHAIVGHSFGGSIAIKGLSTSILSADKLILLASAGVRKHKNSRKRLLKATAKSGKIATFILPHQIQAKVRNKFYKAIDSDSNLLPNMEVTFRLIVGEDVQSAAKKLQLPTLLVYGNEDRNTPLRYGEILARLIPSAKLDVLPGVGHFPHEEQPVIVSQKITEFLEKK